MKLSSRRQMQKTGYIIYVKCPEQLHISSMRNIYKSHIYTDKKQTTLAYDEGESRNSVQAGTRELLEMMEMF